MSQLDEFLSHVHQPRSNRNGDPPPGSATKSTIQYRWRQLQRWDVEDEARVYWDGLSDQEKTRMINVPHGYWNFVENQLESYEQPMTSEATLKTPVTLAIQLPHNKAIQRAGDEHAEIWSEGSRLA